MSNSVKKSRIQEFIDAYDFGIAAWLEAGKIVVEEIKNNPDFASDVCLKSRGRISEATVKIFEKIGQNKLLPQLILDSARPGVKKLIEMPIHIQEKYSQDNLDLVVFNDEGETDILHVPVRNLTVSQVKQVFGKDDVRTPSEQRCFLESERSTKQLEAVVVDHADPGFVFVGDIIHFTRPCRFTIHELYRILANRSK
jgi:hypothetical protein